MHFPSAFQLLPAVSVCVQIFMNSTICWDNQSCETLQISASKIGSYFALLRHKFFMLYYICMSILQKYYSGTDSETTLPIYRTLYCYGLLWYLYSPHIFENPVLTFNFKLLWFYSTTHVKIKLCSKYFLRIPLLAQIRTCCPSSSSPSPSSLWTH